MKKTGKKLVKGLAWTLVSVGFVMACFATYIWVNGLKYDPQTGRFQLTALISLEMGLKDVTVLLNNKEVGDSTPLRLDRLGSGRYDLVIKKDNFYSWQKSFDLKPGQAEVVKQIDLIAQEPKLVKTGSPEPTRDLPRFDIGLTVTGGEILDYGRLVSRLSSDVIQAHRLNQAILYQTQDQLRLYFAEGPQDYLVYRFDSTTYQPLNVDSRGWRVSFSRQGQTYQLSLKTPSGL